MAKGKGLSEIVPLDPNSPKRREVADRPTDILADIRLAIAERERAAERRENRVV
jgi:hypothetical protein